MALNSCLLGTEIQDLCSVLTEALGALRKKSTKLMSVSILSKLKSPFEADPDNAQWRHGDRNKGTGTVNYQRNFKLICPIRGALALVTYPKRLLAKFPIGLLNWA